MRYRRLGRTELRVSLLGIGGGYLMLADAAYGTRVYQRARDSGVNYFDGRYGASSRMIAPVIKDDRDRFIVTTKTAENTCESALRRIDEDLAELESGYIDIFYLRTYDQEMLDQHLAPGGSVEGLLQARTQGKIHFLGLAGHSDMSALARGLETDLFDVCIFPLNLVRRDAYERLIPAAQAHDVGLVVMKPLNAGLVSADLALPWLANQPIHTMVPGISSFEHLEQVLSALDREPLALTSQEEAQAERVRSELDDLTCRICDHLCGTVCEAGLRIDQLIYHDVFYNQYRALGLEKLLDFPLAGWVKGSLEERFGQRMGMLQSCTRCGLCEEACPHHLPILRIFDEMAADHQALLEAIREAGWSQTYSQAPPFSLTPSETGQRS